MGTTAFPSSLYACIHPDSYDADDDDDVTVQRGKDLSELRVHNGTQWRSSFTLKTKTAADRTTFRSFRSARNTLFDSFPFTAPDDGVTRQVRFESIRGRKVGPTVWEYQISLVEVVA